MSVTAGTRLGAYEVIGALGAGGMGEVYRARDTRLQRDVAIKILPALFAADPERLARFEREAKTLAALNHPHIAQVYDVGGGLDAPPYIVMELVAGEDLAALVARGPVPVPEVLDIAKQMALALEAAHELGIVHRDLKPANVRRREDGAIRILDFGLAKAMAPETVLGVDGTLANSPTITSPATALGTIIGTAAYMSPEQARGRAVDKRSDIWAFGVIVFELLTGRMLFDGDSVSDTLASVLRQDIPWSALPPQTPAHLRRLLARCLERDPKRRLRDVGEARLALEDGDAAGTPDSPSPLASSWRRRAVIGAPWLLLFMFAALGIWWKSSAIEPVPAGVLRAVLPHEDAGQIVGRLAITPDGRHVVFAAVRQGVRRIVVRSLDRFELRVLPGTDNGEGPFLSPNGEWIGFFANNRLKRVPLAGGTVEDLAEVPRPLIPTGTWTPGGVIVTFSASRLYRVPERGGTPAPIADAAGAPVRGAWPLASPDGRFVVFMQGGPGAVEDDFLCVVPIDGGEVRTSTIATREPVAFVQGHVLFRREDNALMAARFDAAEGRIVGEPFQVLEPSATAAISQAGTAVYLAEDGRATLTLRDGGRSQTIWSPPWALRDPRISPAGDRIAIQRDSSSPEVWIYDPAAATPTKIADVAVHASWSSDGRRVIYLRWLPGMKMPREVYARAADAGAPETLVYRQDAIGLVQAELSADGTHLFFIGNVEGSRSFWSVPLSGGGSPVSIFGEPGLVAFRLSPDGAWVTYQSTASGTEEIYARPVSGSGTRLTLSTGGGSQPVWRPDGRGVYFRQGAGFVLASVDLGAAPRVIKRETVLGGELTPAGRWSYDVMPGNGGLLVTDPVPGAIRLVAVQGWISEFRDRLAAASR